MKKSKTWSNVNNKRKWIPILLTTLFCSQVISTNGYTKEENAPDPAPTLEVAIEDALIPSVGFDDNDNIQVMIDGYLPGLCYELMETIYKINPSKKEINLQQMMQKKNISECQNGVLLSDEGPNKVYHFPEPYTVEVNMGTLPEGLYTIKYKNRLGVIAERKFQVKKSSGRGTDDVLYAPITNAFMPELIYETDNGEVVLSGSWQSNCFTLNDEDIELQKQGDVFVILPKMTMLNDRTCEKKQRPLRKIISLGKLEAGRYLLHVRSITGRSLNKMFTVIKRDFDPRMNR